MIKQIKIIDLDLKKNSEAKSDYASHDFTELTCMYLLVLCKYIPNVEESNS